MINQKDALALIEKLRGSAVVVPTMTGRTTWSELSSDDTLDLPIRGAMGKAASVALGVCLAQPDRKVIVIDGDGSLLMNLGAIVTSGGKKPANLYHFVIDNGVYGVTGGQPIPNAGGFSFQGIAESSGYAKGYQFDDLEEFATSLDEIMGTKGPVLISLKVVPEIEDESAATLVPTGNAKTMPQVFLDVKDALT